jgi:hypothetical protein
MFLIATFKSSRTCLSWSEDSYAVLRPAKSALAFFSRASMLNARFMNVPPAHGNASGSARALKRVVSHPDGAFSRFPSAESGRDLRRPHPLESARYQRHGSKRAQGSEPARPVPFRPLRARAIAAG